MTIRFGILGCASIARRMFAPALAHVKDAALIAVASRDQKHAEQFAADFNCSAESSYFALLARKDIDAVYLPLPPSLHEEWAMRAFDSGKHVFCEKPLTTDVASTKRLIEHANRSGKILEENWMFLHHRQFQFISDILASGKLGEIRLLRASFGFPQMPPGNFRYQAALGGGALLDAGGYTICIVRKLLGESLSVLGSHLHTPAESEVERFGSALLVSQNGITAQIAFGFDCHYRCELEIWTSSAKLTAPRIFTSPPGISPIIQIETSQGRKDHSIAEDNHFANAIRNFIKKINNKEAEYNGLLRQATLTQALRTNDHNSCNQTRIGAT